MSTRTKLIASTAVIVLIVILFPRFVDMPAAARALQQADLRYGALASLAFIAGLAAYAQRWRVLLAGQPSLSAAFQAANVGHALNILLPLRAGEAARIALLGRTTGLPLAEITASVVVERVIEQVMRLLALGGALLVGLRLQLAPGAVMGAVALVSLLAGLMTWALRHRAQVLTRAPVFLARLPGITEARARRALSGVLAGVTQAVTSRRLSAAMLWSFITWGCFGAFHLLTLAALGADGLPPTTWGALALGTLVLAPPSAPTQPGIFHATLVAPLALLGFDRAALTAFAILLHLQQMVWMIGLALVGSGVQAFKSGQAVAVERVVEKAAERDEHG